MTIQEIVTLRMDRDAEGNWQCPVTTKPFTDHSKIVAIRSNHHGNNNNEPASVYSYAAYHEFNVRAKQYEDLVTGRQFDPTKDVMVVFDPERRADISTFHHIRTARQQQQQTGSTSSLSSSSNVKHTLATSRIMEKIQKRKAEQQSSSSVTKLLGKPNADTTSCISDKIAYFRKSDGSRLNVLSSDVTGVVYTDATASTSLMSTAVSSSSSSNTERPATAAEISAALYRVVRRQKRKGYVQLHLQHHHNNNSNNSTIPPLLVELHCDIVPMTCANFLGLCREETYNGTIFHRLIPGFCIQGGKQPNNAEESSYWGTPPMMRDEFDDRLRHTGSGCLSMANAGPHTNKAQFFITFQSCPHLDRKHSVFGQIIMDDDKKKEELLQQLQAIPTDKKDRPLEPVVLERVEILQDPIVDARERERARLEAIIDRREGRTTTTTKNATDKEDAEEAVGKYLKLPPLPKSVATTSTSKQDDADGTAASSRPAGPPPKKKKKKFGNFSKW